LQEPVLTRLFGDALTEDILALPDEEKYTRMEAQLAATFSILRFSCFSRRHDSNPMWRTTQTITVVCVSGSSSCVRFHRPRKIR
jgi:hypothetical protein